MPVIDVSVLSATDVACVPTKRSFCVYVRLQGQAIRTKPARADRAGEIRFGERFRFQYQPDARRPGRNRMFVELWTKSLFSQACVSVAWIEMAEQRFVHRQQMRMNVRGTFEGKSAVISLVLTPLDFGEMPSVPPQQMPQQFLPQGQPGQMQYPAPLGCPNAPGQMMPYPMPPQLPQAMYNSGPADGVPLAQPSPYSTASYMPSATPVLQDPNNPPHHQCEPAPLPPPPAAFVGASLPPPLYAGLLQTETPAGTEQRFPEALPASDPNPSYNYGDDYPRKPM
ncbi:hypothetical protein ABL78_6201 [Leptomonas seymouri]|uniref:C2 domain-containing protein n=1 Tax=Leptomonas seymouri TaxID=5684 RepID=A0A0N0P409_LEPSE|nr:hypothetical protein ABL78_6201 [Leptomonas seymouri]|eukprot:KPI84756.1 hypothetical protein ABL78_6201 [Leptomonas seymouri]